jgi:3-hydroxybutyryl-CoA dehydrogenase
MIRSIAVLGAGIMGHGIAYVSAAAGFDTTLFDVSEAALTSARERIASLAASGAARGLLAADDARALIGRVKATSDLASAVSGADFVIEAVPERMALKLEVLAAVERHARPEVVVASNTSSLSITEMASALDNPARAAGMHFFNPVHKMKLVEIVRALETSPETIRQIEDVAHRMGKETVTIRESPGFVTSRINAIIGNEAFYMLQEGIASARDIDKAVTLGLNHPMGPFELVDLVGLDTRLSVLEFLEERLGEKYRPCPLLVEYVKAGRLGRKTGRGVYEYESVPPDRPSRRS